MENKKITWNNFSIHKFLISILLLISSSIIFIVSTPSYLNIVGIIILYSSWVLNVVEK